MNLIYRGEDFVAAGVLLTDTKRSLYEVPGSVPHCSLSKAPGNQWKDVGVNETAPIVVVPKSTHRPYKAQYPLSKEAEKGITPIHSELVERGRFDSLSEFTL